MKFLSNNGRIPMAKSLITAAFSIAFAAGAHAHALQPLAPPPDFDKVVIKTHDLGKGFYMLEGEGGDITVVVADDGVIVVDNQFAPLYPKIKAAIAAITNKPVRYVVNTHFHR